MRILHVTTFLQGGAGRIITDLALAQARRGHEVHVVADAGSAPGYGSYPEYFAALAAAQVPVTLVHSTFLRDAAANAEAAAALGRLTHGWPPDVVHAHAAMPGAIARAAGLGAPFSTAAIVHTMHGWGIGKSAQQVRQDLATLEAADAVAMPSAAAQQSLAAAGLRRRDVRVIPYGLEPDAPDAAPDDADRRAVRAWGDRPVALCVGTIGARKNQALLVEALTAPGLGDVLALFVGDGDPAPLLTRARAAGVSSRVLVLGHRPQASRYLALASVLVLPSRNEGLPLAVLEALRAGVPVVASRLPEIAEAVGPSLAGQLFTPDDARALARALEGACRPDQRAALARGLRQRFNDRYTQERMLASYEAWYDEVLARSALPVGAASRGVAGVMRASL